jgi:hypothetical protein
MSEQRWDKDSVARRLEEAADVLDRMPPERIEARHSSWPRVIRPAAASLRSGQRSRPSAPPPQAIDRMDEALGWLAWIEPAERRLVWMRAEGLPWKRITHRLGMGRTAAWQHWTIALHKIASRLNAAAEQERPNIKLLNKRANPVLQPR